MERPCVLLSEASSLTSREFATVLGRSGFDVEAVSPARAPLVRFSRWCRRIHAAPAPAIDPLQYLRRVDDLMSTGRFVALLPTHEQAWLFAAGRRHLPHARIAVSSVDAFDRVQSKVAFASLMDSLGLPQPTWRLVETDGDLSALGFPVWVKAAFSTAGRGVARADDVHRARELSRAFSSAAEAPAVMIQQPAAGRYAQVQALFDHGRLLAAAVSEQLAAGAGGSAAARLSVSHPQAVEAIDALGTHLSWHGGLTLDYLHVGGRPSFIECNPRTVEPANAAAAGVNLPALSIALATRHDLPERPLITRAGVRTRSTMAIALGAAEEHGTRRAVLRSIVDAVAGRPPLHGSAEVLTPVLTDPPSAVPFAIAVGTVLADPRRVATLAGGTIQTYAVPPGAVDRVRSSPRE